MAPFSLRLLLCDPYDYQTHLHPCLQGPGSDVSGAGPCFQVLTMGASSLPISVSSQPAIRQLLFHPVVASLVFRIHLLFGSPLFGSPARILSHGLVAGTPLKPILMDAMLKVFGTLPGQLLSQFVF